MAAGSEARAAQKRAGGAEPAAHEGGGECRALPAPLARSPITGATAAGPLAAGTLPVVCSVSSRRYATAPFEH